MSVDIFYAIYLDDSEDATYVLLPKNKLLATTSLSSQPRPNTLALDAANKIKCSPHIPACDR